MSHSYIHTFVRMDSWHGDGDVADGGIRMASLVLVGMSAMRRTATALQKGIEEE
jgi:hypothetical protein